MVRMAEASSNVSIAKCGWSGRCLEQVSLIYYLPAIVLSELMDELWLTKCLQDWMRQSIRACYETGIQTPRSRGKFEKCIVQSTRRTEGAATVLRPFATQ